MKPRWEVYGFEPPSEEWIATMRYFAQHRDTANGRWARWVLGYTAAEIHEANEVCRGFRVRWKSALRWGMVASPRWAEWTADQRRRRREAQKRVTKLLREQEGNAAWYRKSMLKEVNP